MADSQTRITRQPIHLVSLGQSCQTTHQLTHFADLNPRSATMVKSPFDWLICPPDSASAWLNEGLRTFPITEIVEHRGRAYWPRFKLWFWHGFLDRSGDTPLLKLGEYADRELAKLDYLRENFRSLDLTITQFFLSNTQNNLDTEVYDTSEREHYWFDEKKIDNLQNALDTYFSTSVSLQVVTRTDRCSPDLAKRKNVHLLPSDQSNWKGDKVGWGRLLRTLSSD